MEGGAKFVVTGDSHLLEVREYEGTKIVTAREFLKALEGLKSKE